LGIGCGMNQANQEAPENKTGKIGVSHARLFKDNAAKKRDLW
jgi:hypothetical protein